MSVESGNSSRAKRAPNVALEIENSPDFKQLNEEEKDLVIKIAIMPDKYIEMKNMFIKEHEKNKEVAESFINTVDKETGSSTNAQQAIGKSLFNQIFKSFTIVIYNFLGSKGLIEKGKQDAVMEDE